jgi:metal-responsive CopG/Arc/MetJ family transcriptional regulator
MAKVMVSIPDDLLADIDRRAKQRGTTRSGLLQDAARRILDDDAEARAGRIQALLDQAKPWGGEGSVADWIREDRRRDDLPPT